MKKEVKNPQLNHKVILHMNEMPKPRPLVETLHQHLKRIGIHPHVWIMAWYVPSKN